MIKWLPGNWQNNYPGKSHYFCMDKIEVNHN